MFEPVTAGGVVAGALYGAAKVVEKFFEGRERLIRAKRGDPELPHRTAMSVILTGSRETLDPFCGTGAILSTPVNEE